MRKLFLALVLAMTAAVAIPTMGQPPPVTPQTVPAPPAPSGAPATPSLAISSTTVVLSVASIAAPLIGLLASLFWRARIDFELKAAEIVLSSKYPRMAKRRAEILESLFPHRLPKNFSSKFDATDFPGLLKYEMTLELFKAIASKLEKKEDIEAAWLELFPEVSWKNTAPNNSQGAAPCSSG